jgi:hypothetical protein
VSGPGTGDGAGLAVLVEEHVQISRPCGVNAQVKVPGIVARMTGGADSVDDLDLLRHGATPALFGGIRAPSTLGSFLRSFTWGNVLQLGKVHRLLLSPPSRAFRPRTAGDGHPHSTSPPSPRSARGCETARADAGPRC